MQRAIQAQAIMHNFALATGLSPASHSEVLREPRRYLWTDAFAVCNYLQFYRQSGEESFLQLALELVDQVHEILGQHRKDSAHRGWLSGLDYQQAQQHPTQGGLRIGKRLDERQADEPVNESLEWNQDGQYFHYLTKWMHALYCVSRDTQNSDYHRWAVELAKVAHAAFTYTPTKAFSAAGGAKHLYWKMSIDLSRPLVLSMGQHDPLDGLITYLQLQQATIKQFPDIPAELSLTKEIADMGAMCERGNWLSNDALGIGGLLTDAYKLMQLIRENKVNELGRLEVLLYDAGVSLKIFLGQHPLDFPAKYRLAFRELGLAIGLQTINKMEQTMAQHAELFSGSDKLPSLIEELLVFYPVHKVIVDFWLDPEHQEDASWHDHADINNVMLATSLAPDGYIDL